MKLRINGVDLYVDIEGAGLVADGPLMREKPTLILLHGGPEAEAAAHMPDIDVLDRLFALIQDFIEGIAP